MEVLPSKLRQFKPLELYLPGYEHLKPPQEADDPVLVKPAAQKQKTFFKEEPELWKAYRRMTNKPCKNGNRHSKCVSPSQFPALISDKLLASPTTKINIREIAHPNVVFLPSLDGMECMCYEKLMKIIKERGNIPPPPNFRFSIKNVPKHNGSLFPCWSTKVLQDFRENEQLQYPLSTLMVRWQTKRCGPVYDAYTLRVIFSRFGNLVDIRMYSSNSCIVIFQTLDAACNVMQTHFLGDPMNPLHCTWWHKSMINKAVYAGVKQNIKVKTDPFII